MTTTTQKKEKEKLRAVKRTPKYTTLHNWKAPKILTPPRVMETLPHANPPTVLRLQISNKERFAQPNHEFKYNKKTNQFLCSKQQYCKRLR